MADVNANVDALVIVEIGDDAIEPGRTFNDKITGMPKLLPARQTAYAWTGKRYPVEFKIDVPNGTGPYRPGLYLLGGSLFAAGKYGRLEYSDRELVLVPAGEAARSLLDRLNEKPALKAAS